MHSHIDDAPDENHEHHHHHKNGDADIPVERQAACPVTGDTVDMEEAEAAGHVREFQGQKYYLCCGTCAQLFVKNSEKYLSHRT